MKKQLVVARYNENTSWVSQTGIPAVIYNKGGTPAEGQCQLAKVFSLENFGREAQSFLFHIVKNYDKNLAETTIFTQGDPFSHSPDFFTRIQFDYEETTPLGLRHLPHHPAKYVTDTDIVTHFNGLEWRYGRIDHFNEMSYYFNRRWFSLLWNRIFDPAAIPAQPIFGYAAIIAVPKHRILARPLSYYQFLLSEVAIYPTLLNAYAMEALWLYVFGDRSLYPEANRFGTKPPPYPPHFGDPVNFKRWMFPKIMR